MPRKKNVKMGVTVVPEPEEIDAVESEETEVTPVVPEISAKDPVSPPIETDTKAKKHEYDDVVNFPTWRYHEDAKPRIFNSREELYAAGPGWKRSPY